MAEKDRPLTSADGSKAQTERWAQSLTTSQLALFFDNECPEVARAARGEANRRRTNALR